MAGLRTIYCCWPFLVVLFTSCTVEAKLVDLSHAHSVDTFMSTPLHPKYNASVLFEGDIVPGVYVKAQRYSLGEHGGTHVDAPIHFNKGGLSLDQIPLENTIADGVMIDCTQEVEKDPDYALTAEKVKAWEAENGNIPQKAAVVINFNWSHRFSNISEYFNTEDIDDAMKYRFPVVSAEAIDYLVDERDINILAVDTMGPDLMTSNFPTHVKMLGNSKMITENIKDPGRLPAKGFRFYSTPVKFVGGTGVQVRAFAVVDENPEPCGSRQLGCSYFVAMFTVFVSLFSCLFTHF